MNETEITVIGNLVAEPTLRFTPAGKAVSNVRISSNTRYRINGEWRDGDSLFIGGTLWGVYAENAVASLQRGDEVIARGWLRQRTWETNDGERRTDTELSITAIGPAVRRAPVAVTRVQHAQALSATTAPGSSGPVAESETPIAA